MICSRRYSECFLIFDTAKLVLDGGPPENRKLSVPSVTPFTVEVLEQALTTSKFVPFSRGSAPRDLPRSKNTISFVVLNEMVDQRVDGRQSDLLKSRKFQ